MSEGLSPPLKAGGFTERLRTAMGDNTLRSFASKAGISTSALHQYLSGKSEPSRPVLLALARAAGVSIDWLAGGSGSEPGVRETPALYSPAPGAGGRSAPAEFDCRLLQAVMAAVDQALASREILLPAGKKSRLTALAYADAWRRGGKADLEYIGELIELAG